MLETLAADHQHVRRDKEGSDDIVQGQTQTHHLSAPVLHLRLNNKKVEIASRPGVAPRIGAEADHLGPRRRGVEQGRDSLLDGRLVYHGRWSPEEVFLAPAAVLDLRGYQDTRLGNALPVRGQLGQGREFPRWRLEKRGRSVML